jgi:hypothetical protein
MPVHEARTAQDAAELLRRADEARKARGAPAPHSGCLAGGVALPAADDLRRIIRRSAWRPRAVLRRLRAWLTAALAWPPAKPRRGVPRPRGHARRCVGKRKSRRRGPALQSGHQASVRQSHRLERLRSAKDGAHANESDPITGRRFKMSMIEMASQCLQPFRPPQPGLRLMLAPTPI